MIDFARYRWSNAAWQGRLWHECILYELHVGAFTPAGTFRAAIDKLPHLLALGITAIELMPVAAFEGRHNWGYDGVSPYAPDASYGRPEDLQALVDAAHAVGLMVLLDVVYNHFGPEGNTMHHCAPEFFTTRHATPLGRQLQLRKRACGAQLLCRQCAALAGALPPGWPATGRRPRHPRRQPHTCDR